MTLYELTGQFLQLLEWAEDEVLEQKTINDTLEGLHYELEEKADACATIISKLESNIEMIDREQERLQARKRTIKNNINSLRDNLKNAMLLIGKTKFKTTLHSYNIQKNPPSVQVLDESKIPKDFFIEQEPKLDKKALLAFLKEEDVDYAKVSQTESLRIR